ncbi:MAG: hypothetical protein WDN72_02585 [Alphaproteobacteria bacterium]
MQSVVAIFFFDSQRPDVFKTSEAIKLGEAIPGVKRSNQTPGSTGFGEGRHERDSSQICLILFE